jgi:hypothetical protein
MYFGGSAMPKPKPFDLVDAKTFVDELVRMVPPQYKKGGSHAMPREDIAHHLLHQKVQKIKGYKYPGIIVAIFETLDGKIRYVIEADHPDFRGMLHIFSDNDIEER